MNTLVIHSAAAILRKRTVAPSGEAGIAGIASGVGKPQPFHGGGLHLRGVYARGRLDDAGAVSLKIDSLKNLPSGSTAIGSRTTGWYGEVAWDVLSLLGKGDRELSPFVRYEALDTQVEVASGFARDPGNDRAVRTYGVTYRPIPNIAIKADFQDFRNGDGTGVDQINFALGYLF